VRSREATGDTINLIRIVLDTASLVTAVRSEFGAAREVVSMVLRREARLLMDYKLGMEYRDVAFRQEHLDVSSMSSDGVVEMIESLEELCEPVDVRRKERPLSSDPNDDLVLDVAINGVADVIVTQNVKHFVVAKRFGIAVLKPAELLQEIKGGKQIGR